MQEFVHQAREGNAPPPSPPEDNNGGGDSRGDDRGKVMSVIYTDKGSCAVSLDYLRRRTNFPHDRLWRAFEDLEDIGYVERLQSDPRGKATRWLDNRQDDNDQVFAAIFVYLTETGWHSLELEDAISARQDAHLHNEREGRENVSIRQRLRNFLRQSRTLQDNVCETLRGQWRAARYQENWKRRAGARMILYALAATGTASVPGGLVLLAAS